MKHTSLALLSALLLSACTSYGWGHSKDADASSPETTLTSPESLTGLWTLTAVDGKDIVAPSDATKPATLTFEEGQLGAFAHCNAMGAGYTAPPGKIETGDVISTLMACMGTDGLMEQETEIGDILSAAATFSVSSDGALTLTTEDGRTLTARK